MSYHGKKIDRVDDITLVEIEKIEYHTFSHINSPLVHPLNSIILTESESLVSLFENWNNVKKFKLDLFALPGVQGTTSMQP